MRSISLPLIVIASALGGIAFATVVIAISMAAIALRPPTCSFGFDNVRIGEGATTDLNKAHDNIYLSPGLTVEGTSK